MTNHYRRRPAEIQAIQWTGANETELRTFAGPDFDTIDIEDRIDDSEQDAQVLVEDSHWVGIKSTDWVLKFDGYFVTKSDETFRAVWEPTVEPDQAAVRASIAAALRIHYHCDGGLDPDGPIPCACGWMDPGPEATRETDFDAHMADVVLAVLPPSADRAAVLREVADWLKVWRPEFFERWAITEQERYEGGVDDAAAELRRLAAEAQPEPQAAFFQPGHTYASPSDTAIQWTFKVTTVTKSPQEDRTALGFIRGVNYGAGVWTPHGETDFNGWTDTTGAQS